MHLPVQNTTTADEPSLREQLDQFSTPGTLYTPLKDQRVRCVACAHRCNIGVGSRGACQVRFNADGVLKVPFDYVARTYVRAIETNTVYHVLPGTKALTFGMFGCDLRCPYCHNHNISQALRDGVSGQPTRTSAQALVQMAVTSGCRTLVGAYNEPMISAEWAHEVFRRAKQQGLRTALVSDGHSTPEALRYMRDVTDVFRLDLKAARDADYKALGGRLDPVLKSMTLAHQLGYWVEVVTLVVPNFNHDLAGLRAMALLLRRLNPDIPWHINAFVPRYRWSARPVADAAFLLSAAGMAYALGLHYVYVGNVPGFNELSHTRCPSCHSELVERDNYTCKTLQLASGRCPDCNRSIPGLWD